MAYPVNSWNFQFLPPKQAVYTNSEVNESLIHFNKANVTCADLAKNFANCRRKPLGKTVDPELCRPLADQLLECFNEVKVVPASCKTHYDDVKSCLEAGGSCGEKLAAYVGCPTTADSKYAPAKATP